MYDTVIEMLTKELADARAKIAELEERSPKVNIDINRMMEIINDYRTGHGGVTESYIRGELENFVKEIKS